MSTLIWISFAIVVVLSAKYYAFDLPNSDAKSYKLDALREQLEDLALDNTIARNSGTYRALDILLQSEEYLTANGISFQFAKRLLQHASATTSATNQSDAYQEMRANPEASALYDQLEQFFNQHLHKRLNRRLWLASKLCRLGKQDCPAYTKEDNLFAELGSAKLA